MITTSIEKFCDIFEEMKSLNKVHYEEISEHAKHGISLNPDYPAYFAKENAGELLVIVLRDTGKLVGYYIGLIGHSLHYKDCLQCAMDIIYVDPNFRGQSGGKLLMDRLKSECGQRGIRVMTMGCKNAHKIYMEKLLIESGFNAYETHYSFWL